MRLQNNSQELDTNQLLKDLASEGIQINIIDSRKEIEANLSCNSSGASGQGGGGGSGGGSGGGCRSTNNSKFSKFYKKEGDQNL